MCADAQRSALCVKRRGAIVRECCMTPGSCAIGEPYEPDVGCSIHCRLEVLSNA